MLLSRQTDKKKTNNNEQLHGMRREMVSKPAIHKQKTIPLNWNDVIRIDVYTIHRKYTNMLYTVRLAVDETSLNTIDLTFLHVAQMQWFTFVFVLASEILITNSYYIVHK